MNPQNFPQCLSPLADERRFVVWRWEDTGAAKLTKVPYQVNGNPAKSNDPTTWATAEEVFAVLQTGWYAGAGIELLNLTGIAALDLDKVRNPETGEILLWAQQLVEACNSYAEITPSGAGVRIIGAVAHSHAPMHTKKSHPDGGEIEFFVQPNTGRFITVTGNKLPGVPDLLAPIDRQIAWIWGIVAPQAAAQPQTHTGGAEPWGPAVSDERAMAFLRGSQAVADLYDNKGVTDPSAARHAVIGSLAKGCNGHREHARRLLLESPLARENDPAKAARDFDNYAWGKAASAGAQEAAQEAQQAAHGAQFAAGLRQPVDLFGVLQPTPLPEGVLPKGIDFLAGAMAAEMGCDPAGVAVAMLGAAAGVIPDRVGVKVKENWRERPCIWPMLVGSPTTKKSPMIRAAKAPIVKEDLRRFKAWKQADAAWQALDKEGQKANPRPVMSRLILGEATTEAAQEALRANPNGLFHPTEEASGWLASMERNGKASGLDRSFWLQAYDGGEFAYDRIGRGSVVIDNLSISLLGAIQPEKIRDAVNNAADDGLIQRTIPIILRPPTISAEERDDGTQLKNAEWYAEIIKECATFDFGLTSIQLSPGAKIVRRRVERRVHDMQSLEIISRKLASHIGKYEGLFARLCLIFHVLDYASAKVAKQETTFQELFQISENCALRVERFIFEFLLPHAASFYQNVVGGLDDKDALESIANYILAHTLQEIDARTVYRGDRSLRKLSNFQIAPLFEQLTALGWIEPVEGPQRRSSKHVVNPQVHILFAQRARIEADRREKAKVAMSAIFGAAASRDNGDKT